MDGAGTEPRTDPGLARRLAWATWGFVALGLGLRLCAYLLNFPLWWDEAFVAVNLLERDYLDLLRPLDYGQVGPLLYLWAELTAVRLLGVSEWSLRLVPLACSLASVILFRFAAGRVMRGRGLLLAVAVFAVSNHPIRHAADAKPYATDALASLVLLAPALAWLGARDRAGSLRVLAAIGPAAILASHPAVFVAAGVGLALAVPVARSGDRSAHGALVAYGAGIAFAYAGLYVAFVRGQASAASPGMVAMWGKSFPPLDSVAGLVRWLGVVHSGEMLAYPCGGEGGGSLTSLGLCLVGAASFWRRGDRAALACLVGTLGVALVAAGLRCYPYGGPAPHGSAARVMQYAGPGLCLLIGRGAGAILGRVRRLGVRSGLLGLALAGLVGVGLAPIVSGVVRPYRSYQAEASRRFAREFWPAIARDAEVACLRGDLRVAGWDSPRLGVAVMLVDQAIYSPARRRGGPVLARVRADHPLRCVLGVAGPEDEARVEAWLGSIRGRFRLRSRRIFDLDIAEPGRGPVLERYEVFELIPAGPGADPETSADPLASRGAIR